MRERRIALFMNSLFFFKDTLGITWYMLRKDGKHLSPRTWWSAFKYLLGKPGVLRRCMFGYFGFYRKRFHPWNHDNRHLIAEWTERQTALAEAGDTGIAA